MMLSMTETDYENWRDGLRCGGQEEYGTQYTAASLYEGGWRADALPDLIEQFNLTSDEAERIYNELLDLEQKAKSQKRGDRSMKNIKVEWCENFIRAAFTKHMPPQLKNPGIEVNYFWTLAEKAGLWVRGTYGSPMSIALDNLCTVESVCDGEGHWMFNAFRLDPKEE